MKDDTQTIVDMRALELAAELKGQMSQINDTLQAHLKDCLDERRNAAQARHDFREEMEIGMRAIDNKIDTNTEKLDKKLSMNNRFTVGVILGVAGTIILLLIGIVGTLLPHAIRAIQVIPIPPGHGISISS